MSEFIKVEKDGEVIGVHPDALANHLQLGWAVVEESPADAVAVETPAEEAPAAPARYEKARRK